MSDALHTPITAYEKTPQCVTDSLLVLQLGIPDDRVRNIDEIICRAKQPVGENPTPVPLRPTQVEHSLKWVETRPPLTNH